MPKLIERNVEFIFDLEDDQAVEDTDAEQVNDRWQPRGGSARTFWGRLSNDELLRQQESTLDLGGFRAW